jgi:predicted negative regulator of RcsB-dependent stress response
MNESPMQTGVSEPGVSAQISALQRQVFTLMLILIVVSGTLVAYIYYQSRQLSKTIEATQQQAVQIAKLYNQDFPVVQSLVKQLAAYGQTHPDFQQAVLKKYGITLQTADAMKK